MYENKCRSCGIEQQKPLNMTSIAEDSMISKTIFNLTSIKIELANEELPNSVCTSCYNKLIEFKDFREMFLRTQANLLNTKYKLEPVPTVTIKSEVFEEAPIFAEPIPISIDCTIKTQNEKSDPKNDLEHEIYIYCDYENCENLKFSGKIALLKHMKKIHKIPVSLENEFSKVANKYSCNTCHRSYRLLKQLFDHKFDRHETFEPRYKCLFSECRGKTFWDRTAYIHHVKYNHEKKQKKGIQKLCCEICGKTLGSFLSLENHKKIHSNERPNECTHCGKKFKVKCHLDRHIKIHIGLKNYACDQCDFRTVTAGYLYQHKVFVHRGKRLEKKEIRCDVCEMIFYHAGNYQKHYRHVHLQVKRHKCTYCDKSFAKSETLKNHIMVHTGEKPYQCDVCNRGFIQKPVWKIHMKSSHGIKIESKKIK